MSQRFEGTENYIATEDLKVAVNAAVALERPLLIKGEPGTGKTVLAYEIANALGAELITWHIKSTTKAAQGLYEYDAVTRLRDSQLGDERVKDIRNYIKRGKLWDAFVADQRPVLLIDEIDKADRVSQRSAAGARPDGVLRLRDRRDRAGPPPPDRDHHLQQREGAAGRVPAPLLLPLHPLSRSRHHAGDRRHALSGHQAAPGERGAAPVLRGARGAGPEEEALDLGAHRLAKALAGRGHRAGDVARARSQEADPAAARRAPQERAGRPPVRAARLHGKARGALSDHRPFGKHWPRDPRTPRRPRTIELVLRN